MKSYVSILFPKCNKNFLVIATIYPHEHVLFLYGSEDTKEKTLSTFFPSNRTAKPLEADLAKKWSYRKTTAILILWSIPNGKLVTHWMLIALSMIFVGIADSGFGYMAVSNINLVQEADWIWDILYNTGYLSIAFALVWYSRFFVFDEKREQKKCQESNR